MYVCPKCEEEIPAKVKKNTEECPFCHEPWPPEETPEDRAEAAAAQAAAEEKARHPEGWGEELRPSAPADPSAVHHQEPPKSRTWMLAVAALVVVVLGVGGYLIFGGGKKGKTGGKGPDDKARVTEAEITAMDNWYRDVRKELDSFMGEVCSVHHQRGYRYSSRLTKRVQVKTVRGKKVQTFDFELKIIPAKDGKPQGKLNVFACPVRLAELHRDHPITIHARIWERREVFGAVYKFADITIGGKLLGEIDEKYRKINRNVVLQNRKGFAFSRMKTLPKGKPFEGYRALSTPMRFRMATNVKSFTLANLTWKKIKPGKFLQGEWVTTIRSNELHKQLADWDDGCFAFRKRIFKLDKPKPNHTAHLKLTRVERQVTRDICAALKVLADATKGDKKVDQAALTKAQELLDSAHSRWNRDVYGKLRDMAKKLDSTIRARPF